MIKIQELVYDYKRKADKLDSKDNQDIPLPQIIRDLNEAQLKILMTRYAPNNLYKTGFEGSQKRIDELSVLVVPDEKLTLKKKEENIFVTDLTKTKENYLFLLRASFVAKNSSCSDLLLNGIQTKTDNLNNVLSSPFDSPSLEWRETPYRIAQNSLRVYSDGSFDVTHAIIDYLRYPRKMDITGYTHFEGNASSDVHCELPDFLQNDIVDTAVMLGKLPIGADIAPEQIRRQINE